MSPGQAATRPALGRRRAQRSRRRPPRRAAQRRSVHRTARRRRERCAVRRWLRHRTRDAERRRREARAAAHGDAVAVVCGEAELSYAELNARANQLAHHLVGLGVKPGAHVGLCVARSLDMLVGLLPEDHVEFTIGRYPLGGPGFTLGRQNFTLRKLVPEARHRLCRLWLNIGECTLAIADELAASGGEGGSGRQQRRFFE